MKSRILDHSYVIDFTDVNYDSKKIITALTKELDKLLKEVNIPEELHDWTLSFDLIYNNVKKIGVARKTKSVKSLKLKEVVIHIPVPRKEIVDWGVNENQFFSEPKPDKRYIDELSVEFDQFNNKNDYIIETANRAIRYALESGVTVNKRKLRMKK